MSVTMEVVGWTGRHALWCGRGVAHGLALFSCARAFGGWRLVGVASQFQFARGSSPTLAGSKCLGFGGFRPPCFLAFPWVSWAAQRFRSLQESGLRWLTCFLGGLDVADGLDFEYPLFGEFSWRFGVASGPSLCRTA